MTRLSGGSLCYNNGMENTNQHVAAEEKKVAEEERNGLVGWSWGAFMFDIPFLVGIRKYVYLWWYLLGVIPFVNILFVLVFKIWMGARGRALAAVSPQFASEAEFQGFMKAIDHAGGILFVVALIVIAIALVLGLFGVLGIFGFLHGARGGWSAFPTAGAPMMRY